MVCVEVVLPTKPTAKRKEFANQNANLMKYIFLRWTIVNLGAHPINSITLLQRFVSPSALQASIISSKMTHVSLSAFLMKPIQLKMILVIQSAQI